MNDWLYANYRHRTIGMEANTFDFHSHAQFEIYCFHSGDCKYLIRNAIYDLQPGDIIIMDGLTSHRANPALGVPYERSIVHFSAQWIKPLIESIGTPEWLAPFKEMNNSLLRGGDGPEREKIYGAIKEIVRLTEERVEAEAELKLLTATILLNIFKLSKGANDRLAMPKSEKDVHVEKTAAYIQQHFHEKITLDHISAALSISKFYLSRVFKEVTGITIMEYVMDCRLNKVKYELEMNPERVLYDIAVESGFESPAHFSRFFKKKVGLTPSEYRRRKGES
ncbi:AraC family transcriptional regulator [Domibacillus enclensis]|uniref:AraC family transcriptional regulator n=1 Tax=Domibacillus enclensis TaxID=1017273 RepID=A0A1N6RGN9_9BACI|nr:AraC family transcriptional regulator [Domibacillus enclensis]OXS79056.1 AraC family transcriptional regulator [Domibacillus enclensis]SIQ28023.1 AraC-type DNA-binding protein [Domibacillus enclensis]